MTAATVAEQIKEEGVFETYLGSKEEAVYVHNDDVWVIREKDNKLYSVWNPTNDILLHEQVN
jgi:hypothetical protein